MMRQSNPVDLSYNLRGECENVDNEKVPSEVQDIVIIGAGIAGLQTASYLRKFNDKVKVCLLDKNPHGLHVMSRRGSNTGAAHSGIYYGKGLKAELNSIGFDLMREYVAEKGIETRQTGKLVLGYGDDALSHLHEHERKATEYGRRDPNKIHLVGGKEIFEIAPLVNRQIQYALYLEEPFMINADQLLREVRKEVHEAGIDFVNNCRVEDIIFDTKHEIDSRLSPVWRIETTRGEIRSKFVINLAGANVDDIARKIEKKRLGWGIIRVAGKYFKIKNESGLPLDQMIYESKDPKNPLPFLGIHSLPGLEFDDPYIYFGPDAFPTFGATDPARNSWLKNMKERLSLIKDFESFMIHLKFFWRQKGVIPKQLPVHFFKKKFAQLAQINLNPDLIYIDPDKIEEAKHGVRGQLVDSRGVISKEFEIMNHYIDTRIRGLTSKNPGSPGLTASPAIGVRMAELSLNALREISNFDSFQNLNKLLLASR